MAAVKALFIPLCFAATVYCLSTWSTGTAIEKVYRLPVHTIPIHYDVRLIPGLLAISPTIDGETKTLIKLSRETKEIVFHCWHITVEEDLTTLEDSDNNILRPNEHNYDHETEMLHLVFVETLIPGVYTLNLTFHGMVSDNMRGFYISFPRNGDSNMASVAVTHLQTTAARRVFPCWDEPALKATFKMSIKHYSNYTALSNMPLYKQEFDETDGKVWSHFQTTPLMSTNILAFVLADYANLTSEDGTTRVWTRKDALPHVEYVLDVAERATLAFQSYLNSTVRVPKMDHVSVPHYSSRATENWGLIVYHEGSLVHNAEESKSRYRLLNIMTIIHEISHQWFGNLVSPSSWKYLWMSEGMATYFKYYMIDKVENNSRVPDTFLVDVQQRAAFFADEQPNSVPMNTEVESTPRQIRQRNTHIVYRKSAAVIRMLSHIVSLDVFRAGLIKYVAANEYDSVTSDDLWTAMQAAFDDSGMTGTRVKEVMDSWIEQTGYPIVTVTRDYDNGRVIARQDSITADKDPMEKRWWIPLNYATQSNPNFNSTLPIIWLKPDTENVTIDVDNNDWIIANIQETGYYRVNYDDDNWMKIARFLNSDEFTKVHLLNRAQIIDDAYYMLKRGKLNALTFIHIANYLSRETDYIPWSAAFSILQNVWNYLQHPEAERIIKPYIAELMNNFIESNNFEENSNDTDFAKYTKIEILEWACKFDQPMCMARATTELLAYLDNPKENKMSEDRRYWTYCMGLKEANQSIWNRVLESHKIDYDVIQYLGCSEDPNITMNYLRMSIDGQSDIFKHYSADIAASISDVPSHTDTMLNFLIDDWLKIVALVPEPRFLLKNILYRINTHDQMERFKSFLLQWGIPEDLGVSYRERALETMGKNVKVMLDIFARYRNDTWMMSSPPIPSVV